MNIKKKNTDRFISIFRIFFSSLDKIYLMDSTKMKQRGQNSEYYILEFTRSNPDLDLVFLDGLIRILFNLGGRIRN